MTVPRIPPVPTLGGAHFSPRGYARSIPFGCVNQGLLSVLYFLPGQAMRAHRHLDSDEYFTAFRGTASMIVEGDRIELPEGATFLRLRGVLHGLGNAGRDVLVVQSFQTPLPTDQGTLWEDVEGWTYSGRGCVRCWCGQCENGACANCGLAWNADSSMDLGIG